MNDNKKVKIHPVTCSKRHSFKLPSDDLSPSNTIGYRIEIKGECPKCGEKYKKVLEHRGAGSYVEVTAK